MPIIKISLLGRFDIIVGNESALVPLGNSSKSVQLLKYLILNSGKSVPATNLIDIFWAESEKSSNPENALRTMMSRIRANLTKSSQLLSDCILSEKKAYSWNGQLQCEVDLFIFEELCRQLQFCNELDGASRDKFMYMLELYVGDLYYTESDADWVISRSLYLHHLYLQIVYRFINMLKAEHDYSTVIQVCRLALDIDAFDEALNLELMNALKESGQNTMALMQYRHITSAYYKYLGLEPSERILDFYKDLIKSDLIQEADINSIRQNLKKGPGTQESGAFVCDYSIFKNIYQLQLRNLERNDNRMFLALLTVSNMLDSPFEPLVLDNIMQELMEILKLCLRKGDTISRYSSSQYAVLLPMLSSSYANVVTTRIRKQFYKVYSNNSIKLSFQFGDLDSDDATFT